METTKTYIIEKLKYLADLFPNIQFKYAFNTNIRCHIVEITPEDEYYNNELLDKAWIPISLEFQQLFQDQEIAFVSSDSILNIKHPELIFNQKKEYLQALFEPFLTNEIQLDYLVCFSSDLSAKISGFELSSDCIDHLNFSFLFPCGELNKGVDPYSGIINSWTYEHSLAA